MDAEGRRLGGDGSPTDEEILAYTQSIQDEAVNHVPLLSAGQPVSTLLAEYEHGDARIRSKIETLAHGPTPLPDGASTTTTKTKETVEIYRTRGDGNCFYRAFGFALASVALRTGALDALRSRIEATRETLANAGFSAIVTDDFLDPFLDLLTLLGAQDGPGVLLEKFNDAECSNSIVVYLRLLTSAHIKTHPDDYLPFLEQEENVQIDRWCERWVEAIGAEADHVQINALVNASGVGVDVVHLDTAPTGSSSSSSTTSEGDDGTGEVRVTQVRSDAGREDRWIVRVLYRPGHYDVLL